jgi:hypothetical protein
MTELEKQIANEIRQAISGIGDAEERMQAIIDKTLKTQQSSYQIDGLVTKDSIVSKFSSLKDILSGVRNEITKIQNKIS